MGLLLSFPPAWLCPLNGGIGYGFSCKGLGSLLARRGPEKGRAAYFFGA